MRLVIQHVSQHRKKWQMLTAFTLKIWTSYFSSSFLKKKKTFASNPALPKSSVASDTGPRLSPPPGLVWWNSLRRARRPWWSSVGRHRVVPYALLWDILEQSPQRRDRQRSLSRGGAYRVGCPTALRDVESMQLPDRLCPGVWGAPCYLVSPSHMAQALHVEQPPCPLCPVSLRGHRGAASFVSSVSEPQLLDSRDPLTVTESQEFYNCASCGL